MPNDVVPQVFRFSRVLDGNAHARGDSARGDIRFVLHPGHPGNAEATAVLYTEEDPANGSRVGSVLVRPLSPHPRARRLGPIV